MPTAIVTVLIFNSTSLSHFSWALVWPCFACPGCAGPSPICHAPFAYRWCSPLFTYLPHSSSPWCPCTLAPWRLATAYWWSSPAFQSTCSSLPGSVSPSGSRSPWVSHMVTHRVASGRFPSVCVHHKPFSGNYVSYDLRFTPNRCYSSRRTYTSTTETDDGCASQSGVKGFFNFAPYLSFPKFIKLSTNTHTLTSACPLHQLTNSLTN